MRNYGADVVGVNRHGWRLNLTTKYQIIMMKLNTKKICTLSLWFALGLILSSINYQSSIAKSKHSLNQFEFKSYITQIQRDRSV